MFEEVTQHPLIISRLTCTERPGLPQKTPKRKDSTTPEVTGFQEEWRDNFMSYKTKKQASSRGVTSIHSNKSCEAMLLLQLMLYYVTSIDWQLWIDKQCCLKSPQTGKKPLSCPCLRVVSGPIQAATDLSPSCPVCPRYSRSLWSAHRWSGILSDVQSVFHAEHECTTAT